MADIESNIRFGVDTSDAMASIKALQAQISAFQRQMSSSSVANAESARKLRRGLLDDLNATGQFSTSIRTIRSSSESFTNALEKNKLSMGEYFRFAGGATQKFGKLFTSEFNTIEKVSRERVKDLQTQYISLGRDANGALQSIAVRPLRLDMNDLATQTAMTAQRQQVFNQLLNQGSTNLLNFGKNTQWAGRQLMVGFTIPLSIFGSLASKTFMQLEEQAIRFRRVYGELFTPEGEADEMLETLKELGKEFTKYGVAVEKTLGLAADAAAMGKTGVELLDQVTEANRLAVLGNVEQAKALETTISVTNAFGIATEDLASKIDFLNAVENQTVVSIEDLTTAIPKAGPVVKQLGGGIEELAFFLTAMKEGGINASEGANALKSGLASLINPTGVASEMMKTFGINMQELNMANKGDVKGLVVGFAEALDELDPLQRAQAIEQLFGKFQFSRLSTLFQNVIQEGNQASRVLEIANSTTQELAQLSAKELSAVEQSTTFRFRKAIEEFRLAIAPIGEEFLKLITPIIEFANGIIEKFNNLSDGAKSFITGLTVLLGVVGPVALMTFGLLANGVANIIKGFTFVRNVFLKAGNQSNILGQQIDYMTTEQLQAAAVAASLDQTHQSLIQTFSLEAGAVQNLANVYKQAFNEQQRFETGRRIAQQPGLRLASGILSVPGPKGAGDIVPAVLSPGEAVIPADAARKYAPIIKGMIAGNLPGFNKGVMLGMPRSGKSTGKNREAAEQVYQMFLQSSYRDTPPTNYGHQLSPTSGHSFPIFGLGGVYMGPGGQKVFVKPVMDETAAVAEMRGTQIARQAHGLKAPEQRIVVIRDPQDVTGTRRFLALESKLDSTFVNNDPMALFNEEQYFKQLVASLVRVDKDLAAGNMFRDVVADVGPAGVFSRASGVRSLESNLPSMEDQAMINLLGIKGGAKRAFAESTLGLMAGLTPQQYHQRMIAEIQQVLPILKQTVAGFNLTNPAEVDAYQAMIRRLEQGLSTDWSKFHAIHSAVKPSKPRQTTIPGYADGVVSVPGPKGAGDIMPAMLSPGEAVIPADKAKRYGSLINAMISGNIPGYVRGKPAPITQEIIKSGFSQTAQALPGLLDVIDKAFDRVEESGKKLTQIGLSRELDAMMPGFQRIVDIAKTTTAFRGADAISGDASSLTGVNLTHLNAALDLTVEQAHQLGQEMVNLGFGTSSAAKMLLEATGPIKAFSQLVSLAPRALNTGKMTGNEAADYLESAGGESFLAALTKNYGINPNDPEAQKFIDLLIQGYRNAGEAAVGDPFLYQLVESSIGELFEGATKTALLKAGSEYRSLADDKFRRSSLPGGFSIEPTGSPAPGAGSFTADSVGIATGAPGAAFRDLRKDPAFAKILADANVFADEFAISLSRALFEALRDALGVNSPSAEYEAISNSVNQGVRQGTDDAIKAGAQVGNAVADGAESVATRVGRRRVTTDPVAIAAFEAQKAGGSQAQQSSRNKRGRVTRPADLDVRQAAQAEAQKSEELAAAKEQEIKVTQSAAARIDKLNSVVMNSTFALTSLAGVGIMSGGVIGKVSEMIFKYSGSVFALMQITQLLTQTKILELIQRRALNKGLAIQNIQTKRAMLNTAAFSGGILNVAKSLLRFLGPIGMLISVVLIAGAAFAMFAAKQENDRKRISGLGDAAFLTAEKMKKAGELLGFEAKAVSFAERATAGTAASRDSEERSKVETLRADDGFKADFANEIAAIKNASVAEAQIALSAVAAQLAASGANPEAVDAYVRAIAQEAGRTDLNLNFAKIDFSEGGVDQISENAKKAADSFSKTFSNEVTFKQTTVANTDTLNPFDFDTVTTADMADPSEKLKTSAEAFAGVQAAALSGLASGLQNGLISVADFNTGLNDVMASLEGLSADQASLILPSLYDKLGISETIEGIPQVSDQMIYLKAIAAGVDLRSGELEALENANKKDIDSQRLAQKVRARLIAQTAKQAEEQKILNDQKAEEKFIDEQIANANVQLAERIVQLENQRAAYDILIQQGYSAAEAFDLAGDAGLAAGIKAARAAGLASKDWQDLEAFLKKFLELEKQAPKSPSSSGAPDKTPFEQATEALKEQRREIINNNIAFNKLKKAGLDIASAMEIAEDPITAAALATTKVGTEKWNRLIKAIRTTQALLSKKEIQDLLRGGKVERADKQAQVAVSSALSRIGWTAEQIDEVLSDQEFTNTLAADLKDGTIDAKNLLNRLSQIKQIENLEIDLNFTTKEGTAEEFQKRYDKVVGAIEANKQLIEIEFQVETSVDNAIIRKAEEEIAGLQFEIDNYEASLTEIDGKEEEINKTYDDRKKALDLISKSNDNIAKQQKSQLTLADALSQGDISAAARAVQEIRAQDADIQISKQGDLLELSREQALAAVRTKDGESRAQLEKAIKGLKERIFDIEEKRLEPARENIRLAEVEKNAKLDSLNAQILRWDVLSARVNAAKLKLTPEEMSAMEYQAGLIAGLLEDWDKIEDKSAILTIIKKTVDDAIGAVGDSEPAAAPETVVPAGDDGPPPAGEPGGNIPLSSEPSPVVPASQPSTAEIDARNSLDAFEKSGQNVAGFINQIDSAATAKAAIDAGKDAQERIIKDIQINMNAAETTRQASISAGKDAQERIINDIQINMNAANTARQVSIAAGKDVQNRILKDIQVNMNAAKTAAAAKAAAITAAKAAQNTIISGIRSNMILPKTTVRKPAVNTTTLQGILNASNPKRTTASILQGRGLKLAMGGMVKRYNEGGFAMGTDIIPAMLTPGEFVVRKYAVDNFGTDKLKAINNGTYKGDSMYNYEVNVNVQTDADPDKIARSVIGQIKQIDAQRIRGNRF